MPSLCRALGPPILSLSLLWGGGAPASQWAPAWTPDSASSVVIHVPHPCKDLRHEVVSVQGPQPCPFSPGPAPRTPLPPGTMALPASTHSLLHLHPPLGAHMRPVHHALFSQGLFLAALFYSTLQRHRAPLFVCLSSRVFD